MFKKPKLRQLTNHSNYWDLFLLLIHTIQNPEDICWFIYQNIWWLVFWCISVLPVCTSEVLSQLCPLPINAVFDEEQFSWWLLILPIFFSFRFVSVTTWTSFSSMAMRRRTGVAHGRSLHGTDAGSCAAARRWSKPLPIVCSRSTAAKCTTASPGPASTTRADRYSSYDTGRRFSCDVSIVLLFLHAKHKPIRRLQILTPVNNPWCHHSHPSTHLSQYTPSRQGPSPKDRQHRYSMVAFHGGTAQFSESETDVQVDSAGHAKPVWYNRVALDVEHQLITRRLGGVFLRCVDVSCLLAWCVRG